MALQEEYRHGLWGRGGGLKAIEAWQLLPPCPGGAPSLTRGLAYGQGQKKMRVADVGATVTTNSLYRFRFYPERREREIIWTFKIPDQSLRVAHYLLRSEKYIQS